MRKSIFLILLISFVYQNTSSFWILTKFYIDQEYIAQTICVNRFEQSNTCQGNCYLQSELSADSDNKPDLPNFLLKETQPLFYQNFSWLLKQDTTCYTQVSYPRYLNKGLYKDLIFSVFDPPKFYVFT